MLFERYFLNKNSPQELMLSLDKFLSVYYGDLKVEFKPNLQAINANPLPLPLKYLYSFVGKYPGKYNAPLSTKDDLLSIEQINEQYQKPYTEDNKLIFSYENQGVWTCATEYEGIDPPVWILGEKNKWTFCCNSLTKFLVTFCLQEAFHASKYIHTGNDVNKVIDALKQDNWEVVLLWEGKYARHTHFEEIGYPDLKNYETFYLVEDSILIWNRRREYSTNYYNASKILSSLNINLRSF